MNLVHILPSQLRLTKISFLYYPSVQPHLQSCILPSDFSSQTLYSFPVSPLLITCLTQLILTHSLTHLSTIQLAAQVLINFAVLTKKESAHSRSGGQQKQTFVPRVQVLSAVFCLVRQTHTLTFHTNLLPLLAILQLEVASSFELLVTICREQTLREV